DHCQDHLQLIDPSPAAALHYPSIRIRGVLYCRIPSGQLTVGQSTAVDCSHFVHVYGRLHHVLGLLQRQCPLLVHIPLRLVCFRRGSTRQCASLCQRSERYCSQRGHRHQRHVRQHRGLDQQLVVLTYRRPELSHWKWLELGNKRRGPRYCHSSSALD